MPGLIYKISIFIGSLSAHRTPIYPLTYTSTMTGIRVLIGKIKPQLKTSSTRDEFAAYLDKARVHFNAFPNIKNVHVGQTCNSPEINKGYDFVVVLEFVDDAVSTLDTQHSTSDNTNGLGQRSQEILNSPETVAARATLLDPFVDGEYD